MAIVAECAVCGKRFKADEKQAGKKAKCSNCGTVFVIAGGVDGLAAPQSKVGALAPARGVRSAPTENRVVSTTTQSTDSAVRKTVAAPAPMKVTVSRASDSAAKSDLAQLAPEIKPVVQSCGESDQASSAAPTKTETLPVDPGRPRGWATKVVAIVAVLVVIGGAGVIAVPKLFPGKTVGAPGTGKAIDIGSAQTASHVVTAALPRSGPSWSAQVDVAAPTLKLPDDFRLAIPAQPPLRHNPNSLVLAQAPSPFLAVTLLPNADRSQPTIEVWNLSTGTKSAQFKLNQPLSNALLSQDGGYYAGQFYDQDARAVRVEVWSTSSGTRMHTIDIPSAAPIVARAALGFPLEDQLAVFGDKLQVWDLRNKSVMREVQLPARSPDTRAAASSKLKLVAVADSKVLTLVDLSQSKTLGRALIPEALLAHPRHRLSLRAMEFSPDGFELALLFDNGQATRRIGIFDVATGTLKALHSPNAPVRSGGPDFQWLGDSQAFLVGGGVLLDRAAGRQIGQAYTELPEEGLGGLLSTSLADDHVLAVWDKYPNSLVLRSLAAPREKADWVRVDIESATATRYEQLQCVSREFGNSIAAQSLSQAGRLTDGSQFLVVETRFSAALSAGAAAIVPLRADQFVLVADGQPKYPIGSIGQNGSFSFERPECDVRKGDPVTRTRSVVYAVSGHEKALSLQIGSAAQTLEIPAAVSIQPEPVLAGVGWEQLSRSLFNAPDDAAMVTVHVTSARIQPYELDPEAAEQVPLRVTYSTTRASVLAITFDMTVNTARGLARNMRPESPRLGLLLPDGQNIRPAVELPDILPITLGVGERRTHTCLFMFNSPTTRFRLTYDGVPVATISPESSTARSTP